MGDSDSSYDYEDDYEYDDEEGYCDQDRGPSNTYRGRSGFGSGINNSNKDLSAFLGGIGHRGFNSAVEGFTRAIASRLAKRFTSVLLKLAGRHPVLAGVVYTPLILSFLFTYVNQKAVDKIWSMLMSYALASVSIHKHDTDLYDSIKGWILANAMFKTRRTLQAKSSNMLRYNPSLRSKDGSNILFEGNSKFQFFRHNGRQFIYTEEKNDFKIWTFGYSPRSIQDLILNIQREEGQTAKVRQETKIYVPNTTGSYTPHWDHQMTRVRRSLDTVCLDPAEKQSLIDDIDDHLQLDTAQWYAERDIPYRRGYLLHGKPGCGKTSLAMAIAGQFDLKVHIVSLLDKNLTDQKLLKLFQDTGSGCLVLLEDVDCAGLGRELATDADGHAKHKQAVVMRNMQEQRGGPNVNIEPPEQSGVTLSGLLNAIDGASAPEGHLLIMTTNHPELLDPALIRPGRIDRQIHFQYASKQQIRDMFLKMYTWHRSDRPTKYDTTSIPNLADTFAEVVPEHTFSPAELQQHLLIYRVRPQEAVKNVSELMERRKSSEHKHQEGSTSSLSLDRSVDGGSSTDASAPVSEQDEEQDESESEEDDDSAEDGSEEDGEVD